MAQAKKTTTKKTTSKKAAAKKSAAPKAPKQAVAPVETTQSRRQFRYKYHVVFGVVLLLLALLPSVYFYNKYQDSRDKKEEVKSEQSESEKLIQDISKHALLPTEEVPTVATVSDVSKLQGQPFFAEAENGDRVLVYADSRKVVLYRPSIDRIINMTPLNVDQTPAEGTTPTETPTQ